MAYRTFGDLKSQIERELDLETEDFIQPEELVEYFNSAVREAEAEILKLGLRERYLITDGFISTVQNQAEYDLPADIIDSKIRKIIYRNGVLIYELKPILIEEGFEAEDVYNLYSANEDYGYMVYKVGEDLKLRLIPKANVSVTDAIRIIYEKDLNRYTDDDTNCDVPEIAYEFILAAVRFKCVTKEIGRGDVTSFKQEKEEMRKLMQDTLQGQLADPNQDLIDQDLSAYQEHT